MTMKDAVRQARHSASKVTDINSGVTQASEYKANRYRNSVVSLVLAIGLYGCGSGGGGGGSDEETLETIHVVQNDEPPQYQSGDTPPQYPSAVVFDNVNVITMSSEHGDRILSAYRVVTQDDQIIEMGPEDEVEIPDDAQIIDGNNGYLIPGLIDSHTHLAHDGDTSFLLFSDPAQMSLYLQQGITTLRAYSGTPRNIEWRDKVASQEWLGTRIVSSGPVFFNRQDMNEMWQEDFGINITSVSPEFMAQIPITVPANNPAAIAEVNRQYEQGYDFVKVYSGVEESMYLSIVAAVSANNGYVAGHIPDAPLQTVLQHHDEIGHMEELLDAFDESSITWEDYQQWLVDTMLQNDVALVFNWSTDEVLRELQDGVNVFTRDRYQVIPDQIINAWMGALGQDDGLSDIGSQRARELVKRLIDAGVIVLAGSDSVDPGSIPEFVHRDLEILVEAGVSPYQALLSATRHPAEVINDITIAPANFGEVKEGYIADLVLLQSNPLDTISNTRNRQGVMVNGHWFVQENLNAMAIDYKNMPLEALYIEDAIQ